MVFIIIYLFFFRVDFRETLFGELGINSLCTSAVIVVGNLVDSLYASEDSLWPLLKPFLYHNFDDFIKAADNLSLNICLFGPPYLSDWPSRISSISAIVFMIEALAPSA